MATKRIKIPKVRIKSTARQVGNGIRVTTTTTIGNRSKTTSKTYH